MGDSEQGILSSLDVRKIFWYFLDVQTPKCVPMVLPTCDDSRPAARKWDAPLRSGESRLSWRRGPKIETGSSLCRYHDDHCDIES